MRPFKTWFESPINEITYSFSSGVILVLVLAWKLEEVDEVEEMDKVEEVEGGIDEIGKKDELEEGDEIGKLGKLEEVDEMNEVLVSRYWGKIGINDVL